MMEKKKKLMIGNIAPTTTEQSNLAQNNFTNPIEQSVEQLPNQLDASISALRQEELERQKQQLQKLKDVAEMLDEKNQPKEQGRYEVVIRPDSVIARIRQIEETRTKERKTNERLVEVNTELVELLRKQAEPQALDSTVTTENSNKLDSERVLTPSNNDVDCSGLLNNPARKDDWFNVIDDMTRTFYGEHNKRPNETQAWAQLWTNPPKGYAVSTGKVSTNGEDCLNMPSVKSLSFSAFKKRWTEYTANKAE